MTQPTVDGSAAVPNLIDMYWHCAKCLAERPPHLSPQEWARTQAGFTPDGLQVWCVRHDLNIGHVKLDLDRGHRCCADCGVSS